MTGYEIRALRERLGVCVEALAEAIGLRTETIEYVEHYGYDWAWVTKPAMDYLLELGARPASETPKPPRWCIAMGEPFLAHCAECAAAEGAA